MSERLTDEELQAWAEKRADDAGRLARELVPLRAYELNRDKEVVALRARVAKLEAALMAMLDDWDNLCEGGMMKGVNSRITAARAALKDALQ
jgi:hypothetical protein